jgi:hypothetical protein
MGHFYMILNWTELYSAENGNPDGKDVKALLARQMTYQRRVLIPCISRRLCSVQCAKP